MRRDIGNEVIVAIAVLAVLVFAVTFGILLSVSDPAEDTALTQTPGGVMTGMINTTPSVQAVTGSPEATAEVALQVTDATDTDVTEEIVTETTEPQTTEQIIPTETPTAELQLSPQATATAQNLQPSGRTPDSKPTLTTPSASSTATTNNQ
ncbi:MAG: hypothetical protein H7Y09_11260, partial [Chitinophagaceae bacterium]|nr:hypothetical protein [Anaerolineae bacterium]